LLSKSAWAENPHSRTRRLITNVRVLGIEADNILATANFSVHRMRYESVDTYIGRYEYKLIRMGQLLKIRERRAILDNEALRPHGKISFIL
jgi:p-cumate 2,3-dioxygenase beta subunit